MIFESAAEARVSMPGDGAKALRNYYLLRGLVSAAWVVAAFTVGRHSPPAATALLIAYPAWDAAANLFDALRSGGLSRNPAQAVNAVVSAATAAAIAAAGDNIGVVLGAFGAWAILAGLLQLIAGVRRWRIAGAQWAMVLSGAQSMLAGGFFLTLAAKPAGHGIQDLAGYAGFGAFYFLVSAIWLTVRAWRSRR